ncbi:interactor of HORMAD1 protein 1 [Erinaceus europaeus]|uniref:Interactor of HORMAD1 protein 1 n=1 Tax=Erinaceus europaeus TaxID=9365 RepID=A0A1S3AEF0_ERIEU|nr:interactor of HORMAD1 protein 1 [Erinaceus europaeus]
MNFNVWNIKEMLSMPSGSGTTKPSSWSNNQTDYSSLSDSQFLFGSQFCPESSETLTAPLDFGVHLRHPKQTKQNALDSEPNIFTKYQTKPQLFGGDTKDGELLPFPLTIGKSKSLLEQFEEKKNRAKDKCDSETLYKLISHVRESIHRLQTSVETSEEHLSSRSQSILDSLETMAKTLQETARAQNALVAEAVQDKGNLETAILEMQRKLGTQQAEFVEMKSNLTHLEAVVTQQSKDLQQLCEQLSQLNMPGVLEELKRLLTGPGAPRPVKDSTCQTLPPLTQAASEEAALQQAQTIPDRTPPVRSPQPEKPGVRGQAYARGALQEEAALLTAGSSEGNRGGQDKAVQADCMAWAASSDTHGSRTLPHKVPGDKDLASQGASQLTSLDANSFVANIKNTCPNHQAKRVVSCDPCEEKFVTEQKCRTVQRRGTGRRRQPRKALRGRLLVRKQEHTHRNTCLFRPDPQPPSHKRPLQRQQEPLAQPLHLWDPLTPKKPDFPPLQEAAVPSTAGAAEGSLLQLSRQTSPNSSSQGNNHISWFSGLKLGTSESPLCKEPGRNLLYDLAFDSSDDGF